MAVAVCKSVRMRWKRLTSCLGAANISPDDTPYADGEITREGPVGDQGDGAYSAGRGGAGNIDKGTTGGEQIGDEDIVPETATRTAKDENFHYGRGGAGNTIKTEKHETVSQYGFDKKVPQESLKDKIKDLLHHK